MNCIVCQTYLGINIQHEVCSKRSYVCCPLCNHKGHLASECSYVRPGGNIKILNIDIDTTLDKSLRNFIHAHNESHIENKIEVKTKTNSSKHVMLDSIKKWASRQGYIVQFVQKVPHVCALDTSISST